MDEPILGCLGLVDQDFDTLLMNVNVQENVINSTYHDFDIDMIRSEALATYLTEVGDRIKMSVFPDAHSVCTYVMRLIRPLSMMRFANQTEQLQYDLSDVKHHEFMNGDTLDVDAMISSVSTGRFSSLNDRRRLRSVIDVYTAREYDLNFLTNGHDFCAALGICLRDRFGSRKVWQTFCKEIEKDLRLSFGRAEFRRSNLFGQLRRWEEANKPYLVLSNEFRHDG